MKNKSKLLFILIICLLIIIIISVIIIIKVRQNKAEEIAKIGQTQEDIEIKHELSRTTREKMFFTIDECIKSYFLILKAQQGNVLIGYLNEQYIRDNNINEQNVLNIVQKYNNYDLYITLDMYELINKNITTYLVKGEIDSRYIFFEVGLDGTRGTYDIKPITEEVYNQIISGDLKINERDNIEKNTYNVIRYKDLTDEAIARLYFSNYIQLMLIDTGESYNRLNEEYKSKRFENVENFNNYINDKRKDLSISYKVENLNVSSGLNIREYQSIKKQYSNYLVTGYSVDKYKDYTRYICADGNDNYYIFNVKAPGDYNVLLDAYTVDLPEFVQKYQQATDENKVVLNAEKIRSAINDKNYKYVYDRLDHSFKSRFFDTLEDFERNLKNNMLESYIVSEVVSIEKEQDIYVYNAIIKDKTNKIANAQKLKIYMQLKDDTDFVMSFNVEW